MRWTPLMHLVVIGGTFLVLAPAHASTEAVVAGHNSNASSTTRADAATVVAHTVVVAGSESSASANGSGSTPSVPSPRHAAANNSACTDNASTTLPQVSSDCPDGGGNGSSGGNGSNLGWQSLLPGSIQ